MAGALITFSGCLSFTNSGKGLYTLHDEKLMRMQSFDVKHNLTRNQIHDLYIQSK